MFYAYYQETCSVSMKHILTKPSTVQIVYIAFRYCKLQPKRKALPLTHGHARLILDNFRDILRCRHVMPILSPSSRVPEQDVYLCAAVLASRIPALCIHERTGVMPLVRGSSFMVKAPRGRLSWMENM